MCLQDLSLTFLGKGPSIWDTFAHEGGHIYHNDSGDVAADGYHHYLEDIRLIKSMNVRTLFNGIVL